MQSPDHPGENDNASNAKVYISNINKSVFILFIKID